MCCTLPLTNTPCYSTNNPLITLSSGVCLLLIGNEKLTNLSSYLELALNGPLDGETRDNLSMSHAASKNLLFTINDLLVRTVLSMSVTLLSLSTPLISVGPHSLWKVETKLLLSEPFDFFRRYR